MENICWHISELDQPVKNVLKNRLHSGEVFLIGSEWYIF